MFRNLFKSRVEEDIKVRTYYSKYIFNSHFILFLSIAAGVLLYTLLGLRDDLRGNIYVDLVAAILMSVSIMPVYRSLLKEADVIFLTPVEKDLGNYFKSSRVYSFILGIPIPLVVSVIAFVLLIINHNMMNSLLIILTFYLMVIGVFALKVLAVNSDVSPTIVVYVFIVLNTITLFLQMQNMMFALLGIVFYLVAYIILKNKTRSTIDWLTQIEHEKQEQNRFDTIISMFANVPKREKSFKRRNYFDVLMKKQNIKHYNQDHMYDYLFHRSFLRDFDLPMIMIRLFILCSIFIIWMGNIYISIIFILFVLYIMILQLQGLYTAQAYLLWPKIWPVSREKIRNSYIRYSRKLILVISILFMIVFICIHPIEFYISLIFPVWALLINKVFSKNVYKKEEALSD